MQLTAVGVDHRSAPAELRERLHLDAAARARVLGRVAETFPGCEALLLATCNRTELVLAEPEGRRAASVWHLVLDQAGAPAPPVGEGPCSAAGVVRARREGTAAARHVIRVAAGLESAVLGDVDVLRQLRGARQEAVAAGTCGKFVHHLVRVALRTGKQVRHRTALASGGAGIGSATAALVTAPRVPDTRVVVVGAGVAARGVLAQLRRRGVDDLTVVNRTHARAVELARAHGARAVGATGRRAAVARADVVVVAAPGWEWSPGWWATALAGREDRPTVVDVCLPRAVVPHPGIDLRGLDHVAAHRDTTLATRAAAVPAAEELVDEAVEQWQAWTHRVAFDDHVRALYASAERQLQDVAARVDDPDLVRAERARMRRALHEQVTALRAAG